jgi:hypothetical protein
MNKPASKSRKGRGRNGQGFTCNTCGEHWETHPFWVVPCSKCFAPAGSPCVRPSEHINVGGYVHVEREQAAVDSGLVKMCPKGPTALGRSPKTLTRKQLTLF